MNGSGTKRLSKASIICAEAGISYGLCINTLFGNAQHNSCLKEFELFKKCFVRAIKG
jgi:hypothetical protein